MDRFDLENKIMELHSMVDCLHDIVHGVLEEQLATDEIATAIEGVAVVHRLKINQLFDTFQQVFNLDEYCNDSFADPFDIA